LAARARRRRRHLLFDDPTAQADFKYWAKVPHWNADEAAALSLGYEPKFVNPSTIEPYLQLSDIADEFARRLMLISRAITAKQLEQWFSAADFIDWAERLGIGLPNALREAVATMAPQDRRSTPRDMEELRHENAVLRTELEQVKAANKDPSAKERRSLHILVATMASRHYDFSPFASRNIATKAIVDDASLLGLSIDKDTVLHHLRQAYRALGIKGDP
jgi:hypothetical protein